MTTDQRICSACGDAIPADAPHGTCPKCLMGLGLGASARATDPFSSPAGQPFVAPTPAEIAGCFPQLELIELLGQGGMGAVYKARQPGLDRLVAVKILPAAISDTPGFAQRFAREGRALARMSHPNIVTVYDSGERDGLYFFIMEYVDGTNLRELIQSSELSPAEAMSIVPQVCEALQFAHENGIVHRDIKPENILVDKSGRVKIADFGLAKLASGERELPESAPLLTLTGTHQVMGTPRYMAPEQIEGSHHVDHRADIYSLGVVFYELLTGELPLGRFDPPSHKVQVDVRLDEVVLRTLEKSPEKRYQRASEIKTDVERIERSPAAPAALPEADVPPKREAPADQALIAEGRYLNRGAAWGMATFAAICLAGAFVGFAWFAVEETSSAQPDSRTANSAMVCFGILALYGGLVMLVGVQMLNFRWQLFNMIVCGLLIAPLALWGTVENPDLKPILSTYIASICIPMTVGVPFAIWSLAVLSRRTVRAAYRDAFEQRLRDFDSRASQSLEQSQPDPRRVVFAPSIAMIVSGAIIALVPLAGALIDLGEITWRGGAAYWEAVLLIAIASVLAGIGVTISIAGLRMQDLRNYRLVVTCAIATIIASIPLFPLIVPSIWVIWTLFRQDVRAAFRQRAEELRLQPRESLTPKQLLGAAESLQTPGVGLLAAGALMILLTPGSASLVMFELAESLPADGLYLSIAIVSVSLSVAALQITASFMMRRARAWPLCMAAAIAAMLPLSFAWIMTFSFGLWAFAVLVRENVRQLFAMDVDARTFVQTAESPKPPRDLKDSPYYAAGWLLGGLWRLATTPMFAAVLSFLAAATLLLPWGWFARDGVSLGQTAGYSFWSGDIIATLMLLCGLFQLATGELASARLWRPLIVVGFVLPAIGLLAVFRHAERLLYNLTQAPDQQVDGVDVIGGYYLCWALVVALLIVAALQVRAALQERQ